MCPQLHGQEPRARGGSTRKPGRPPGSGGGSRQVLGSQHVLGTRQRKPNSCPQGASRLLCLLQKHGALRR